MKKLLLLPLCAALLLAGCNGPAATTDAPATPEARAKAAQDSLMAHHDRLMGQADRLIALAARLQAASRPPRPLLARMQAADNAMMSWMHQYSPPDSAAPAPQRLTYLQTQQRQLTGVEKQLAAALDSATALAGQLPLDSAATAATPKMRMDPKMKM
ncbi:MAG: hypothetical protein ACRYFK_03545 [Janthinobacterium lividum]